jgi:F-type H+-transporting ATPase subunit delta
VNRESFVADVAPHRIADRYASALYDVADAARALKAVQTDLRFLAQCFSTSMPLVQALSSVSVAEANKLAILLALLDRQDSHMLTRNWLRALADNQRLALVTHMLKAFEQVAERHAGVVTATVTTALPLTSEQEAALTAALRQKIGVALRVLTRVRPELLDGLTVQVGSVLYDGSLHTKLQRLELQLKKTSFGALTQPAVPVAHA